MDFRKKTTSELIYEEMHARDAERSLYLDKARSFGMNDRDLKRLAISMRRSYNIDPYRPLRIGSGEESYLRDRHDDRFYEINNDVIRIAKERIGKSEPLTFMDITIIVDQVLTEKHAERHHLISSVGFLYTSKIFEYR